MAQKDKEYEEFKRDMKELQKCGKICRLLDEDRNLHNIAYESEKAIPICDEILKLDKDNRDALLIKAGALHTINKEKEAYELLIDIVDKWPYHWEAYYVLGIMFFNTNEEKAAEFFEKSLELKETFDNLTFYAQLLYFLRDSKYKTLLMKAQKLDPIRFKRFMKEYWEWEIC
jgi:tetratricopeptide (TPR) repeat protein